jgi:betaine-homocysteine S-methyltransferase
VVGLNCYRGPDTMLPLIEKIREKVKCHVAAVPVPYRTTLKQPIFQCLCGNNQDCKNAEERAFPVNLDPFLCTRNELADFAKKAYALGVHFIGVCCGAGPHHIRSVAEALGKKTEASEYSPDLSKHFIFGNNPKLFEHYKKFMDDLIC